MWVGHLSKLVQQEELSDTFGKYGDIVSIDMIPPRGCAFIVMHRRQDANRSMQGLKNHKMHNRVITISWAAGKGVKSKEWKDYWDIDLGVSYIPWEKLSRNTDFVALEEGGMFDEDTIPAWMKEMLAQKQQQPQQKTSDDVAAMMDVVQAIPSIDTSQPPPMGAPMIPMVAPFPMGPVPRLMPPMGLPGMVPMLNVPPPGMLHLGAPGHQGLMAAIPPPGLAGLNPFAAPPPLDPVAAAAAAAQQQQPQPPTTSMNDDRMDIDDEENKHEMGGGFNQPPPPQILGSRRGDFINERDDRRNSMDRDGRRGRDTNNRNNMRDNGRSGRPDRWNSRDRDSYERDGGGFQRDNRDNNRGRHDRAGNSAERTLQDRLRDLAGVGVDGRANNRNNSDFMNRGDRNRMGGNEGQMRDYGNNRNNMDDGGDYDRRGFQQQNRGGFPMRGSNQGPQFGNNQRGGPPGVPFMRGGPRQGKVLKFS